MLFPTQREAVNRLKIVRAPSLLDMAINLARGQEVIIELPGENWAESFHVTSIVKKGSILLTVRLEHDGEWSRDPGVIGKIFELTFTNAGVRMGDHLCEVAEYK